MQRDVAMMMGERRIFQIPREAHDHIYFGNLVYGGMLVDKTETRKREDGLIERQIVFFPSPELIDKYDLRRDRDASPQGLILRWYPENLIVHDVTNDSTLGRRTFIRCDFRKEPTRLMNEVKELLDNIADLQRELQNKETKIIRQKKKELKDNLNPDASFDQGVERLKKFREVFIDFLPRQGGNAPPEV